MRNVVLALVTTLLPLTGVSAPLTSLKLDPAPARLAIDVGRDWFGFNVDLDADVAAILAPRYPLAMGSGSGAAFVSLRIAGIWQPLQRVPIPLVDNRLHARSLSLDGDTLVLGSYGRDGPTLLPGRVDIFVRSGEGGDFVHQTTLVAPNASSLFGISVAIDGDDLIVGDQWAERVTVYRRGNVGQWTQTGQLLPPDGVTGSSFSVSLAIEGDLVAVGRPLFPSFQGPGALLVYRRPSVEVPFAFEYSYTIEGGGTADGLSYSQIDIDGERVIAGAPDFRYGGTTGPAAPGRGAVVVLERQAGSWGQWILMPSDAGSVFDFGVGVALKGDRALVGAQDALTGEGRVYAFVRGESQWVETQRDLFGGSGDNEVTSISIFGDNVLVGVPSFQTPPMAGTAYIHSLSDGTVPDISLTLDRVSANACSRPAVVIASWMSDGSQCKAVDQGVLTNTRWTQSSCEGLPADCPNPLDFRVLSGTGQARFTASDQQSGQPPPGSVVSIECTDSAGRVARASA